MSNKSINQDRNTLAYEGWPEGYDDSNTSEEEAPEAGGQPMHATGRGYSDEEFKALKLSGKPVKSTDPSKGEVVNALKEASKGTKVTCVKFHGAGTYSGDCMVAGGRGQQALRLGRFIVEIA